MPQRSLASLVLGPIIIGLLCLALACVAGERTDRLGDTLRVADTLHVSQGQAPSGHIADSVHPSDSSSAAADSAAASQIAVAVDSSVMTADSVATRQQGRTKTPGTQQTVSARGSCCDVGSSTHRHAMHSLSPLADSIANSLVFVPRDRAWFTVASRGKRMLVDIGRIDISLARDSVTRAAFLEAVSRLSPLPIGSALRLRGPYEVVEEARIKGFDVWNGRIVARLEVSKNLDSLARAEDMLPATAVRVDTATAVAGTRKPDSSRVVVKPDSVPAPPAPACVRDTLPTDLATRGITVRDSLAHFLVDSVKPPYERMITEAKVASWWIPGCFGISRLLVIANRRTPDMEFAVERAVLVDSTGKVLPVRFSDLRFHAHDPLYVFDADGDGIDDLAARGFGDRSGGLTIMRLDVQSKRFLRLASGFAWER